MALVAVILCFNPTLVRLRLAASFVLGSGRAINCFNPTLVRLRHARKLSVRIELPRFQSHAGSIEAGRVDLAHILRHVGFNPTLVRLRRRLRADPAGPGPSFNPTLVRLRQGAGTRSRNTDPTFQSHAGSIEAHLFPRLVGAWAAVSIPRWFD